MKYIPTTLLSPLNLPDGSVIYTESLQGFGSLGMKDPNRGKKVGGAVSTAGGLVAAVGGPVGVVVGGIMAAAGALISAFSNSKATQRANAEAAGYEQANTELQSQNQQLDAKINELQAAIVKAKISFGLDPNVSLAGGLGWCLINCAKNDAKARLETAKGLFDQLTIAQDDKIDIIERLSNEAQRLFDKETQVNYAYIGAGLLVVGAFAFFITRKAKS